MLQDVTVIFRRRGGDDLEQSHAKWVETVQLAPDVINMTFTPIISLLEDVPGIKHLARAIELYLECKISFNYMFSWNVNFIHILESGYQSNTTNILERKKKRVFLEIHSIFFDLLEIHSILWSEKGLKPFKKKKGKWKFNA